MNKKRTMTIAGIVALALILCIGGYFYHDRKVKEKKFEIAAGLFKNGSYTQAAKGFEEIGGFKDADKMTALSYMYGYLEMGSYTEAVKYAGKNLDVKTKDEDLQKAIEGGKVKYYMQAKEMAGGQGYDSASKIFTCLGDYKDSVKAASYYEGHAKIEANDLKGAIESFEKVKDYEDAATLSENCSTYLEAAELQAKGDDASLEQAADLFTGIESFQDAKDRALACRSVGMFRKAKALADKKDYDGAYKILNQYPYNPYEGWQDLHTECSNQINYKKANKLYKDEHFYQAMLIFRTLGDFKDSAKKAEKCDRGYPSKKILYHNPDYESSSVEFTIKNSATRGTYIKLYSGSDKLAARIFIPKNDSATISLTPGTYHINQAYGDTWYGKKDMFGDSGYYTKCKVAGNYNFELKSGYRYTMGAGAGGDAVSSETVTSSDF